MITRTIYMPNRPGRPAGPTENRGLKPYDPRRWTSKRAQIIQAIFENNEALTRGDMLYSELARAIGTSPSYLSLTKNSPWGQQRLRELQQLGARRMNTPEHTV